MFIMAVSIRLSSCYDNLDAFASAYLWWPWWLWWSQHPEWAMKGAIWFPLRSLWWSTFAPEAHTSLMASMMVYSWGARVLEVGEFLFRKFPQAHDTARAHGFVRWRNRRRLLFPMHLRLVRPSIWLLSSAACPKLWLRLQTYFSLLIINLN